jgi:hypothetical protein
MSTPIHHETVLEVGDQLIPVALGVEVEFNDASFTHEFGTEQVEEVDVFLADCEPSDYATRQAARAWLRRNERQFVRQAVEQAEDLAV